MVKRKNTDQVQIKLRLVEALRKRLEAVAKKERRSLNSQLVLMLEQAVEHLELLEHQEVSRQWDKTRALLEAERDMPLSPSGNPRRRLGARSALDATDEQLQANLRATAEGYRRSVKRLEARGEDEKAAEMRELADRTEREARALTQRQAPPDLLDDEPELFQDPRQAKGGQK